MSFCKTCHHPCHCGEDETLHADEYGVCTCENCECEDDRIQNSEGVNEKSTNEGTTSEDQD